MICVAGRIGAGKTTFATNLGVALGLPVASFGSYLRASLRTANREALADAGQRRVETDAAAFVRDVAASAGWTAGTGLIFDGIRHRVILDAIRDLAAPQPRLFIYLAAAEGVLRQRRGAAGNETATAEEHASEQEVLHKLSHQADLILDATETPAALVERTLRLLATPPSKLGRTHGAP